MSHTDNSDEIKKEEAEKLSGDEGDAESTMSTLQEPKQELERCQSERKEYLDGWQRARADHLNYKKDESKRLEDIARYVSSSLVGDMLPVLDSFDLALGHGLPPEVERGILLIRSQLEDVLKRRGLEHISTQPGAVFDPALHESIGEVEAEYPPGSIAEVVQKGYRFNGKVLRPARVRLAK